MKDTSNMSPRSVSRLVCLLSTALLAPLATADNPIDRFIFEKIEREKIPVAAPADDSEFVRRIYLDLTGRLPETGAAREFLASKDPAKRQKLIESLFPEIPKPGLRSIKEDPFLDRWAYFFNDLFRNGQLLEQGINSFYDHIYKSLMLNIPYDEFVRDLITASATSTYSAGPANFLARSHVFEGDGYMINHEDTLDEVAINTGKLFLGVNLECISCHDGRAHLEKVNLWLSQRKRAELWRQASFFGKTLITPAFGRTPQFMVKDNRAPGYNLTSGSAVRPKRNPKEDVTPTFILDAGRIQDGEPPREAFARLLTSHPQFARATVNLFWTELMGLGIVDGPFDFDLARQDPKNPPPAPWTIQPSHPELLDALADGFRQSGYDLRQLIRTIVSSRTYALSATAPKGWKSTYETSFARRQVRRLSAEQLWDAIGQTTGVQPELKITYSDRKVKYLMQTFSPQDIDKSDRRLHGVMGQFGQCDRYAAEADRRPSMIQSAVLLNDGVLRERVKTVKGSRLEALLKDTKTDEQIVDELYIAALSRLPDAEEREASTALLKDNRQEGAEDLLWVLVNRLDFLFY